jgi:ribosomal protein L28
MLTPPLVSTTSASATARCSTCGKAAGSSFTRPRSMTSTPRRCSAAISVKRLLS